MVCYSGLAFSVFIFFLSCLQLSPTVKFQRSPLQDQQSSVFFDRYVTILVSFNNDVSCQNVCAILGNEVQIWSNLQRQQNESSRETVHETMSLQLKQIFWKCSSTIHDVHLFKIAGILEILVPRQPSITIASRNPKKLLKFARFFQKTFGNLFWRGDHSNVSWTFIW